MDKKTFLKISGHKTMKDFYAEFPDEASFLKVHGKAFRKAMRGEKIAKADYGYNAMNAGTSSQADAEGIIQGATSSMQNKEKKSVGNQIAGVTKDIPVLGSLVSGIVGLFDERKERMRQQRAAKLSTLTLQASESAPRRQPNKYLRPDMDQSIDDINSLMPAEGTGTNMLARYGKEIPQANFGSILTSLVGSGGGSGSSGLLGNILGAVGGGGGGKEEEKKPELSKVLAMNSISGAAGDIRPMGLPNLGRERIPQRGLVVPSTMMMAQEGVSIPASSQFKFIDDTKKYGQGLTTNFINSPQYKNIDTGNPAGKYVQGSIPNGPTEKTRLGQSFNNIMGTGSSTNQGNEKSVGTGGINMMGIDALNNAGGRLGNELGSTVGSVFGTAGQIVGGVVGSLFGLADAAGRKMAKAQGTIRRNQNRMLASQIGKATGQLYAGQMRTGGRLGRNPSDMERNGELKTLWGGHAEPLSYNPYLPEGGETIMFRGNSHNNDGIGVHYGDSGASLRPYEPNVEVEGGEPAVQLPDRSGENNLVVFGNLPIPKQYISLLGDPNAKGKRFKGYVKGISKKEDKQNRIAAKATEELDSLSPANTFDKIKADTLSLIIKSADRKQQKYAGLKQKAADLQQAINDTAEEYGVDAESLLKGKMKAAKGASVSKAQTGQSIPPQDVWESQTYEHTATQPGMLDYTSPDNAGEIFKGKNYNNIWKKKVRRAFSDQGTANQLLEAIENYRGTDADDVKAILAKEKTKEAKLKRAEELATDGKVGPYHHILNSLIDNPFPRMKPKEAQLPINVPQRPITPLKAKEQPEKKGPPQFINPMGNYLPSNVEELDPRQLTGEYYALATNQLEPVPAQLYQPTLRTPYEISLQDILNENTASVRGAQRLADYNPAVQSMLLSSLYGANQKVLGEQFRINQEMKDKVYGENTNILNDAQLKNLAILDTQYQRQAQALSRTKDVAREALSSISDKYLQNQLANRTLATYENLYNYRYDPNYHAWNMNGPAQWNMDGSGNDSYTLGPNGERLYPQYRDGKFVGYIPEERATITTEDTTTKYPKKKNSRNGTILKAMKSL